MGDLVDRIAKLPDYQKILIGVVIYVLIFFAFHMLIHKKLKQEIFSEESRNTQLTEERNKTREIAENKDQFQRDVE